MTALPQDTRERGRSFAVGGRDPAVNRKQSADLQPLRVRNGSAAYHFGGEIFLPLEV